MELLQKIKNSATISSNNPTTGYKCPKEVKSVCQRDLCTSMFIAALFTIAKKWRGFQQTRMRFQKI
jgi:hypothetical protein